MLKTLFVNVLLDESKKPLDYSVPQELQPLIQVGSRVEVPLKSTLKKGTVASIKVQAEVPHARPIVRLLAPHNELSKAQWQLAEWMAHYYATPLQKVLRCFFPSHVRREAKTQERLFITLAQTRANALSACRESPSSVQAAILERLLQKKGGLFFSELTKDLSCSRTDLNSLLKKKLITIKKVAPQEDLLLEEEFFLSPKKELNEEQKRCLETIIASLEKKSFAAHLLFGVTGSGKTEVYLQAIQRVLDRGKSALLLVPEISLTSQTIERFRARFPEKIAVLHHRRSLGMRMTAWQQLQRGEIRLAIGARSAIFSPIQNLGLIIVDEEHDSSYKQSDEMPCYHGRDVAVMRAHLEKAVVLLGSATPSLESRYNAERGKYQLHELRTRAVHSAALPRVTIVDMKRAIEKHSSFTYLSQELLDAIQKRLSLGEQALLLLNRRGYHRMQMCAECRCVIKCPHCDLPLTYHRKEAHLSCHLCQFTRKPPCQCPSCNSSETLQFKGFGTEHVERALHAIFPEIRTLRMDRDTTARKNSHEELFAQFRSHKADLLIGTQMIAKGLHFPAVTLVGVLNADAALSIPDFRSTEKVFQLLTQVAGRAGRSELQGEVLFQAFNPDHPTLQLAARQDYPAFYQKELEERRLFGFPPFCHLIKLLFAAEDPALALSATEELLASLKKELPASAQVLPSVPSGHPKVKDLYRFQCLLKVHKIGEVAPLLQKLSPPQKVFLKIDVDPLTTFF